MPGDKDRDDTHTLKEMQRDIMNGMTAKESMEGMGIHPANQKSLLAKYLKWSEEWSEGPIETGFEGPIISQLDVEAAARERLRQKYGEDNEGHPRQGMTQHEHKPDPMINAHREEMARLKKIDLSKWRDHIENNPKTGVDDIMKKVHKQYKASPPSKYSKDYDIVWDKKVRPFLMHEFPDS